MFIVFFPMLLSIILCQCSSAIYGFTTKSSSPIMIPIACLLACFLIHSLTQCFLFLPPFMSEWSVKSFHYVCCHHGFNIDEELSKSVPLCDTH
jgi:hypothetical protein